MFFSAILLLLKCLSSFLKYTTMTKSLQSCPTLCHPTDGSPPSSPIPGILQARTLEWGAIAFSASTKLEVTGKHSSKYFPKAETIPLQTHLHSAILNIIIIFITNPFFPEKAMATHSSTLAWKIPWMEEPGRLQSMGSLRVRHDWVTSLSLFTFMHWRRKWQPTPLFLPGEPQGQRSLVGCRLWGRTESDTTEVT